jgi:RHS repeat-associated protein
MYLSEGLTDKGFFPSGPGSQCGMIHNDHLATPQRMTDASGTVVWAADYKPFGEATVTISTITNNLRFPGQYYDAETGLNYNYFRDYNPAIGRYVQSDPLHYGFVQVLAARASFSFQSLSPIQLIRDLNSYTYAMNNSITNIDRRGLAAEVCMRNYWPFHVSVYLNGSGYGFYPDPDDDFIIAGRGKMFHDYPESHDTCKPIKPKCGNDYNGLSRCLAAKIAQSFTSSPAYNFFTFNCQTWADKIISDCGGTI